jgi:hypothetical protein
MSDIADTQAGASLIRAIELLKHAGNSSERAGFGDEGVTQNITDFVQRMWDLLGAAGIVVSTNRPSREDVNVRPVFWLLQSIYWMGLALEELEE